MQESIKRNYLRLSANPLVRGFAATLVGGVASRVFLVLTTFVVARMLSPNDFGQFSFVRSTMEMILSICAVNFSSLCIKYVSEISAEKKAFHKLILLFIFCFSLCIIFGAALYLIPETVLLKVFLSETIIQIFKIIGIILPVLLLTPLLQGIFKGLQQFKLVGALQTIAAIFFFVIAVIFTHLWGVEGALWSVVIYYIFFSILITVLLCKRIKISSLPQKISGFTSQVNELWKVILPMFAMSFVEAPAFWFAQLILSHQGGFAAIGAMTVIMQIRNIILIVPGYFFGTFMAFASKMNATGQYSEYYNKFDRQIKYLLIIALIGILGLICTGRLLLGLFGKEYISAFIPYIVGTISLPGILIASLLRIHFVIKDYQRALLAISISWNVLWLGLFYGVLKFTTCSSLIAFFGTQLIAVIIYVGSLWIIYIKDKKLKQ